MKKLLCQLLTLAVFASLLIVSPQSIEPVSAQTTTAELVNVAVDGTASQSSTRFGGVAGRAIDGNTSGVWQQDSVTHTVPADGLPWWEVELASPTTIDSIVLWNRTNCCSERLADFTVFVSNAPFASDATIAELVSDPTVWSYTFDGVAGETTEIPVNAYGRYVRVQKPAGTALSLAEVEVFAPTLVTTPDANVAPNGAASQSSTGSGGVPLRAVDGNTSGVWQQGSVTHTTPNDQLPSWEVDLGATTTVDSVVLWNRTNCCANRLSDFSVFISNTPFSADATIGELQADPNVWSYSHTGAVDISLEIPVVADGQYVRVQKPAGTALSLAEVQVFEAQSTDTNPATNLAPDGTASQSTTSFNGAAARAIDGNTSGVWQQGSVTHTQPNDQLPWWQVDLGVNADIDDITIWNRTNCCANRLADFTVFVSVTPFPADATIAELQADPTVWSYTNSGVAGTTTNIAVDASGRYVRIQKPSGSALSLAEVEVFGVEAEGPVRVDQDARLIASTGVGGDSQLSWLEPFGEPTPYSYEIFADGVSVGQTSEAVFDTTITGQTEFEVITTTGDGSEFVSETITAAPGASGDCVAVGLNDGTTAITWESAPDGFLTLLDNNDGVYTPLSQFDDDPVNGHHYYVDSITTQAGSMSPDYRVVVMYDDGTFGSQQCTGSSFTPPQAERLSDIDFPVTPDGRIGRDMAGVSQEPMPVRYSNPADQGMAPSTDPTQAAPACSAGGLYLDVVNTPTDEELFVSVFVPAGTTVSFDSFSTKSGSTSSGNWVYYVNAYYQNEDGTQGAFIDRQGASTRFYWRNSLFPDSFEERYYHHEDRDLFTAPVSGNYLIALEVTTKVRIDESDEGAASAIENFKFTDPNGFVTEPCALDELFKCQADGGNVYIAADYSYQSSVAIDEVPVDLSPGCYSYDHCASSPFTGVVDTVAIWACENEQLLDAALGVSVAVAVVAGTIVIGPVVAVGAGFGGALAFWTCDQTDNAWWEPSTNLDATCVSTEVALGAVFAPLGAAAAGARTLGRQIGIACAAGAAEGATSTAVHMTMVDEDEAFNFADAVVGSGVGCLTGGILEGAFGRFFRKADGIRETGFVEGLPGPSGNRRPYTVDNLKGQFFEYSCAAASCAMVGGRPEAYWREAATTTLEGTRLSDVADALTANGHPSVLRENLSIDELALSTQRGPAIAAGNGHDVVVDRIIGGDVYIRDPFPIGVGESYVVTIAEFIEWWDTRAVIGT